MLSLKHLQMLLAHRIVATHSRPCLHLTRVIRRRSLCGGLLDKRLEHIVAESRLSHYVATTSIQVICEVVDDDTGKMYRPAALAVGLSNMLRDKESKLLEQLSGKVILRSEKNSSQALAKLASSRFFKSRAAFECKVFNNGASRPALP